MAHQSRNVPAGTHVVALAPIRGAMGVVVHPRGAVGLVTRTPCGQESHFLIRFPDGFESSFLREEFEVLERFKDFAVAASAEATGATPLFDLDRCLIYRCLAGSRAFGLDDEASDTDLRGVYVAPAEAHWSLFGVSGQFEDSAGQWTVWELQKFLVMALKANPNILECLYSPVIDRITPLGEELISLRSAFLSQVLFQTFNGYAMSQFKKIEQDRRNRGEVRPKHVMHLLRLLLSGAVALREGYLPVRVEAHRERLLAVKRGELSWEEIEAWRSDLHLDFSQALIHTALPERPDYEAANTFLIKARRQIATSGFSV